VATDSSHEVLSSILALFFVISATAFLLGIGLVLTLESPIIQALVVIAIPLCIAQGWFEISLKLAATNMRPAAYGRRLAGKNSLALLIGVGLALIGFASKAPLIGMLLGTIISWYLFDRESWTGINPKWPIPERLREYASYGIPLAITFALGWIISSSDRFIIAWLIDNAATGVYAAGYDLAQQSLGLLLAIVNTAAYPLLMRALAKDGVTAATKQLKINGELIITISLSGSASMIALTPAIVETIIGPGFRTEASKILPWIAASAAVAGIKAFHFDIAFQLARQSKWQAYLAGITAILNVALNFILIPHLGITGAAIATLVSFSVSSIMSWALGRKIFAVPPILPLLVRGSVVALACYAGVMASNLFELSSLAKLLIGILFGTTTGVSTAFILNIAEMRKKARYTL
jgi:O-antigen/teichoic acid export membrane protein